MEFLGLVIVSISGLGFIYCISNTILLLLRMNDTRPIGENLHHYIMGWQLAEATSKRFGNSVNQ